MTEIDPTKRNELKRFPSIRIGLERKILKSLTAYSTKQEKIIEKNHHDKFLANAKLQYALDTGKVIRPNKCSMCGIECIPQGHHHDYSKPLDVIWLCAKCHSKVHVELRREEREK